MIAFISATLIIASEARKEGGVQHCMDKMRGFIQDSCTVLSSVYKMRRKSRQVHVMDNEILPHDDPPLVQFLENGSKCDLFILYFLLCHRIWVGA